MGLYKPAMQLQTARIDINYLLILPGELHIVVAQLLTIGAYIENSGLDFSWTKADLSRHMWPHTNPEAFFKVYPELASRLTLKTSGEHDSSGIVQQAHKHMVDVMKFLNVIKKMTQFDSQVGQKHCSLWCASTCRHAPVHQFKDISQVLLRPQLYELRSDDFGIFGRHLNSDHGGKLPLETSQEMAIASRMAVVDGMAEVQK